MIIPRIQNEIYLEGKIKLEKCVRFSANDDLGKKAVEALKLYLPKFDFEEAADSVLCFEKVDYEGEKYSITVGEKIVLKGV